MLESAAAELGYFDQHATELDVEEFDSYFYNHVSIKKTGGAAGCGEDETQDRAIEVALFFLFH